MKKRFILLIIGIMLMLLASVAFAQETLIGTVVTNDVNMRKGPDVGAELVTTLPIDAKVEIIDFANNWYHVNYLENTGYIRSDLVFVNSDSQRFGYVLRDDVSMHGGPGASTYVIRHLQCGQAVTVTAVTGGWYYCNDGEHFGFVDSSHISMTPPGSTELGKLLKVGMQGDDVLKLQKKLCDKGFLSLACRTGYYGSDTKAAVAGFQSACGMQSDGIAGDATLEELYDPNNTVTPETAQYNRVKGTVELLDWFKGGSEWLNKGAYFVITDVHTGLSFNARRFGGWYHADSEPVTAKDTAIMKKIAGGSWSWDRHAVWVTYKGKTVAASIHCMPHMANPTSSNNFPGHFCVHLLHSKVHANSKECPRHQHCVMKAYNAGKAK